MINVTRSSMPDIEEYIDEIRDIWENHWLTNMGPKHRKLQEKLKEYLGVENVELMTNGHMALELTLQAMNLQGEVITTPFTFASTTHAIVRNGLVPVFCDVDPVTSSAFCIPKFFNPYSIFPRCSSLKQTAPPSSACIWKYM